MSLRDAQTMHLSNLLARDSIILLVSATKMVRACLQARLCINKGWKLRNTRDCQELRCFCKSHPGIVQMGYSFGKHCWKEDSEDDYFERKIEIKPHLQPLDLQGEFIMLIFFI